MGGSELSKLARAASISVGLSFGVLLLIDRFCWKWRWFRLAASIRTPVLHGRWVGTLRSSHTAYKKTYPIVIEFKQTLHRVSVRYFDKNAITHSRLAGFSNFEFGDSVVLICVYYNQPITKKQPPLQPHSGVMELYFDDAIEQMKGTYYNDPHQRQTMGEMALRRTSNGLLGRFEDAND